MRTGITIGRSFFFSMFLTIAFVAMTPLTSYALDKDWFGGTGNWSGPLNWSPNGVPGGFGSCGLPLCNLNLTNTTGVSETASVNSDVGIAGYSARVYGSGTGTMTLSISNPGNLLLAGFLDIKDKGILDQTGGTLRSASGTMIEVGGTFNLQGGQFTDVTNNIGVAGVFNQTGGIASP